MNKYFLKLVGNHKLADWRWRFDADGDAQAIDACIPHLQIIGVCPQVYGAKLIRMEPLAESPDVREFVDVFTFDVRHAVIVKEAG